MKIVFATANAGKLREAAEVLGPDFEIVSLAQAGITEDIPETGSTLQENSLQKAQYLFERTGLPCFADDTGLEVEALGGAPGIYSARYAGPGHDHAANMDKLLKELAILAEDNNRGAFPPDPLRRFAPKSYPDVVSRFIGLKPVISGAGQQTGCPLVIEVGSSRPARSRDFWEAKVGKGLERRRGMGRLSPIMWCRGNPACCRSRYAGAERNVTEQG